MNMIKHNMRERNTDFKTLEMSKVDRIKPLEEAERFRKVLWISMLGLGAIVLILTYFKVI
ncbi:MAG: hypothetical protein H7Y04_08055 [Verrucomicrobia bacterium]|nr:hypothetical protein [Cytophagales bacterium]